MKKTFLHIIRVLVVIAAVIVLAITQDMNSFFDIIKKISLPHLFVSVCMFIVCNIIVAVRWKGLLKTLDIHFPCWAAIKVNFVGLFYNNVLLGAIGGDFLRGWYVTKYSDKRLEAAFSVLVDRLCGLAACFIMAFGGFVFSKGLFEQEGFENTGEAANTNINPAVLVIAAVAIAFIFILAALVLVKTGKFKVLLDGLIEHWKRIWAAIIIYAKKPASIAWALFLTLIGQSITVVAIFIAGSSMNIDVSLKVFFIIFPISWVIGTIPISPGGLGVLELGIVAMFAALPQVTAEQALALAICQRLIFLIGSIPGLVIHLSGIHLPKTIV